MKRRRDCDDFEIDATKPKPSTPSTPSTPISAEAVFARLLQVPDVVKELTCLLRSPMTDGVIVVAAVCKWPSSKLVFHSRAAMALFVKTCMTLDVRYPSETYSAFQRWMMAPWPTAASSSERHVMRRVALKLHNELPCTPFFRHVPIKHLRKLFSAKELAKRLPAPGVFLSHCHSFWMNIRCDADLLFVAQVMRHAWRLGPAPAAMECPICFDSKPADAFGMLTCGAHALCCACILKCRAHSANSVFRCPMRCSYNCGAVPLALHEYLRHEHDVLLRSLSLHAVKKVATPVRVHAEQYVQVAIFGTLKTWVKVERVIGNNTLLVCNSFSWTSVLPATSDFVFDVAAKAVPPLRQTLTPRNLRYLEDHCTETLTFVENDDDEDDEDDDEKDPVQHYARVPGEPYWQRVKYHTGPPVPTSSCEAWFSLRTIYSDMAGRFELVPSLSPIACTCEHTHLALQTCRGCQRHVCTTCFGSPFSLCVICRAEDKFDYVGVVEDVA